MTTLEKSRAEMKKELYKLKFLTRDDAKEYLRNNDIHNYKLKQEKNGTWHIFLLTGGRDTGASLRKNSFSTRPYISIARQLCYPESVINAIRNCETEEEVIRIMTDARHGIFPKEV